MLPHTLNATALAVPRIILTLLENGWNEDKKRVDMPDVLKPWLPFEWIGGDKRNKVIINQQKQEEGQKNKKNK